MFATPAYAQAAGGAAPSLLGSPLIMMAIIFAIFYFLMIRPQQKKQKEHAAQLASIRRGDQIVTQGGVIGKVTKVKDDNELEVEIAQNVKVRVVRSTVVSVMNKTEPAEG